uniref:Uncharacterized protein n=1 Tax=candidate division WOR-3 bacterium TaxID=2052148 RepID=A0A7V1EHU6_UNCW3
MTLRIKSIVFVLFFILTCSERKRMNQFDVGSDSFTAPPPCYTWGAPVYDPYSGELVAVQIAIEFTDGLQRTLSFSHKFLRNSDVVLTFDYSVDAGSENYGIQISYGGEPFPLGDYCLKVYWGEFGYGAFKFSVVPEANKTRFKGITNNEADGYPENCLPITLED